MTTTTPQYFSLAELIQSETAKSNGIDNTPDWQIVDNLKYLAAEVLDPLRIAWGKPLRVTSGFRCVKLNAILQGSAKNSHHKLGLAADIQPLNMKDFEDFKRFVVDFFNKFEGEFDQVIIEKNKSTQWIHISVAGNRRQIFNLTV